MFHFCLSVCLSPLFLFGRICFVLLVMRKRGESSWSGPWHLGCTSGSFPCAQLPGPVHTARLGGVCFSILSLGLCFACSFVLFWFLCLSPFFCVFWGSWVISLAVLGTSVKNLNEPLRALAISTITWVTS